MRREVARCEGFDVGIDYGRMSMRGTFHYDGGGQGFGYQIDAAFVERFLAVFRAETLRSVNGRYCWVTHTHCDILKVEPMLPEDGQAFDVSAWAEALRAPRRDADEGAGKETT